MRLGDLDKAEAVLRNIADHLKESGCEDLLWASAYTAADVIKKQRTIDAVPVVRCAECKHWVKKGFQAGNDINHLEYGGHCPYGMGARYESDFCSLGERKDGDG